MTAYYLKTQYISAFKVKSDLKQAQSFHHLLGLSDKAQMIKSQNKLALRNMSNLSTKHRNRRKLMQKKEGKQPPASSCWLSSEVMLWI